MAETCDLAPISGVFCLFKVEKYDDFCRFGKVMATWAHIWESILGTAASHSAANAIPVQRGKKSFGMPVFISEVKQLLTGYTHVLYPFVVSTSRFL